MVSQWIPFWDSPLAERLSGKAWCPFSSPIQQQCCCPSGVLSAVLCGCLPSVQMSILSLILWPYPLGHTRVSLWFQVLAGKWRGLRSVGMALLCCSSPNKPFLLWSFALLLLSNSYSVSSPIHSRPHGKCRSQEPWLLNTWNVVTSNWDVLKSVKYTMGF